MPICGVQICEAGEMYEPANLSDAYASLDGSQSCLSLNMKNMMARRYKGVDWEGSGSWMEPSNKAT